MREIILLALAATMIACGSNDDASTETDSSAALPGGGGNDDCRGTLTGGPHPGALSCRVQMSYTAGVGATSSEPDVTTLTVLGSLKDGSGSFSQNLVFHGRAQVQTYDQLVYEARQGIAKKGTVGTASFNDSGAKSLFSADRASVNITAVEPDPQVPAVNVVSGSAEWDLSYSSSGGTADATISITFEDQ